MSLFPAYAEQAQIPNEDKTQGDKNWLENSSFNVDVSVINKPQNETSEIKPRERDDKSNKKHKKKSKSSSKKKKPKKDPEIPVAIDDFSNEEFKIDKTRTKEFLTVSTIHRPSAPRYHIKYFLSSRNKRRKSKIKRYFDFNIEKNVDKSNSEEEKVITKQNINDLDPNRKDENFAGLKQEEDLSKTTAEFNRNLAENPHDVKMWLDYVKFQDTVYKFEKTYRKGSIAKGLRVLADRKLSIIDKALTHNVNCEILLRERLNVAVSVYPADELQSQLKILVEKEQGNIILWQGYIEATQCSMSHCNTPAVLNLYTKCLSTLHKLRRNATIEKALLEENILRMLYQCGLFLKQAGLFEQLWTLLRLYLELNLSPNDKSKFNVSSKFDENQLVELEDVVFKSQLPLHELWLRTEKLRESCHWLPYMEDGDCEDMQRVVFTDDVAELIHPITMPDNTFKLTATILTLLKIPLLPCRQSTMQKLGLDYVPWGLDSIESLLPTFMPTFPVDVLNNTLINENRLAIGPQYLRVLPGQEEYLEFIFTIMKNCGDCLKNDDQLAVIIWWFRFQRLLIILDKQGLYKMSPYFKKKIKTEVKNLLKQGQHRNNELFYCEYALIEFEWGNIESALNIIQMALKMNDNKEIVTNNWSPSQIKQCYLYRTMVEIMLNVTTDVESNKRKCVLYLSNFILQTNNIEMNHDILVQTENRFKLITKKLLENYEFIKKPPVQHFLPDFLTDFVICNGWFIFLTKGAIECGVYLENILSSIEEKIKDELWQKEVLFEFYVAVIFKYCVKNPGSGIFKVLDDVLYRAIEQYPNNLFLLSVLSKQQSLVKCIGQPWWKLKNLLLKSGRAFPIVFSVLIVNQQILHLQEFVADTVTGTNFEVNSNFKNKMLSLFRQITKPDMCTRRCGLVWRLYLQFVHSYFDSTMCRNVYFSAVEECPWLKALYIDAAIYIPTELPQIQDLIIEKQLRLHVTPEELEVLRS